MWDNSTVLRSSVYVREYVLYGGCARVCYVCVCGEMEG